MLKISDFARLTNVSGRMLRHYDDLGLLAPAYIDSATNYRYYSLEQLPRLNRIVALKDLGFSLEQIKTVLDSDIPAEEFRGMLRLKRAEIEQEIQAEQARLARIEARLRHIEQENNPSAYDVVLKSISPLLVATKDAVIDDNENTAAVISSVFDELRRAVPAAPQAHQRLLLWQDMESGTGNMRMEVAIALDAPVLVDPSIRVYELPAIPTMACVVYQGSYRNLTQAVYRLYQWIEANGFQTSGLGREILLRGGHDRDDPSYLTEIQIPVDRTH